jgi:hypothetical protein
MTKGFLGPPLATMAGAMMMMMMMMMMVVVVRTHHQAITPIARGAAAMTQRLSAQDLLRQYGIAYVANARNGKYTANRPHCAGNYLSLKFDSDGTCWLCRDCGESGPRSQLPLGAPVAIYDYEDEHGLRLFQSVRFESPGRRKEFRQRTHPVQERWSISGARIVPFKLPELITDLAQDRAVLAVEGEKDVLTLRRHCIPATTNPMGAVNGGQR